MAELAECDEDCTISVWPSASAFTTAEVPIWPPAPGRFSTMTGCFQCSFMRCAMMRAAMSAPAPADSGTMMRMALEGYSCGCCACPATVKNRANEVATLPTSREKKVTVTIFPLSERRHVEPRGRGVLMRPARGDDLGARIELDALDAMHVQIAEERALPAAEREVRHRHGNRHVDADHADLNLVLEAPRGAAGLGKDRRAVRVRIAVDQLDRLVKCINP